MIAIDQTLHAIAEPTRRRAIEHLATGACAAGALAKHLGVSPAALSRHLRVLRRAGLITDSRSEKDQRIRVLVLQREGMAQIRAWTERFWTDTLDGLQAHLDGPAETNQDADS